MESWKSLGELRGDVGSHALHGELESEEGPRQGKSTPRGLSTQDVERRIISRLDE